MSTYVGRLVQISQYMQALCSIACCNVGCSILPMDQDSLLPLMLKLYVQMK
jgi:hypothetical protein